MQFDKARFFADYRVRFGRITDDAQVRGLDFLLDQIALDNGFTMIREAAYLLATVKGETGTFQPRREIRANRARQPGLWNIQQRYWPSGFFGRGYVQITHRANYLNAGNKLRGIVIDVPNNDGSTRQVTIASNTFVDEPNLVMQPIASYLIASRGMREGWFRSRPNGRRFKLSDFVREGAPPDYVNARNIINSPRDRAAEFAGFADKFELCLRASQIS
ncbi:MAG: hypothetical protein H7Y30_09995 [Pyrinomonadaceae bacterium]|nr:hypothetical protein [Pyrinomonadaceae bacterium]